MLRSILLYGTAMAAGAAALQWLEYRYAVRLFRTDLYAVLIASFFAALGGWAGHRLTRRRQADRFPADTRALGELGISDREFQVLQLLAAGHSNREIAARLFVSPNTVKTHLANLYGKLGVRRRTEAVHRARALRLIA